MVNNNRMLMMPRALHKYSWHHSLIQKENLQSHLIAFKLAENYLVYNHK